MRVLVVEDEASTLQLLALYFESAGHQVTSARDGVEALEKFHTGSPELVLLDVRLPRLDGWSVLQAIRARSEVPVILLTALDSSDHVVKGLSLGADDYLRKPFQLNELDARIQAVQRRVKNHTAPRPVRVGPLRIDDRAKTVTLDGEVVNLSPKEYELLKLLASDPGRVFTTEEIIARLWPGSPRADGNDVKQYVHLLRKKIGQGPGAEEPIETAKGFGYKLVL